MVSVLVTVAEKVAEYTVGPVFRQFRYLFNYKNNVDDLMEKVTSLKATRDSVQLRVDRANRNSETIYPRVEDWLKRVNQIIQEKETRFEQGRLAKATTCCSPTNLKVRHSLSRRATKMIPKLRGLLKEGTFPDVSDPAPAPKIGYEVFPYYEDSIQEVPVMKPHEGASSSSNPTDQPAPAPAPEYRLPYTRDLLTALLDDKIHVIGISGGFREIDKVTSEVFIKRIKQRNLFDEVVMAVVSKDPDLNRVQGEIADMLQLKLENGSLHERAERLREAMSKASDSKRLLIVLTHVWQAPDLEAIGISQGNNKKWKVMLISDQSNVFNEMDTHGDFRLLLQSTPEGRAVEFESRIQVMRDVMDALTDEETNPIVMYGMGGIGKTTLLKEIAAKASEVDLFGEVLIAIVTQDPNLSKIQGEIAKGLGLEFKDDDSLLSRAAKLRERISASTTSVLVILDDVWRPLNLREEVGIPKCCKVLVSSRDQDIFKEKKTRKKFHIGGLSEEDAWSLFKKEAGNSIELDPELKKMAEQVLEQCGGLPVAISTVGRALQGKGLPRWRDALRQLKKASPDNVPGVIEHVYGKIEFSYECLPNEEAKSCFLLCCIFPKSQDIEVEFLVKMGLGLGLFKDINSIAEGRDHVQSLVDTIKGRCLLLESDGGEEGSIRMHDVVRDVAVYIASEMLVQKKKNDHFGKRIVLKQQVELDDWRKDNDIEESIFCASLTTNISTGGHTELLWLDSTSYFDMLEMPAETFQGMEHLKVLLVSGYLSLVPVMSSLPLVLKNLETLIIGDCHLQLDVIGALPTLKILELGGSNVKELPGTFKHLSNLKLLDVRECHELKKISPGVISSFSKLEEFYMPDHFRFEWVTDQLATTETTEWISQREVEARGRPKEFNMALAHWLADEERSGFQQSDMDDSEEDALTRWAKSRDWTVGILSELLTLSRLTTLEVCLLPVNILLRNSRKLFRKLERFKISIGWGTSMNRWKLESYDNYLRVYDVDASSLVGTDIVSLFKMTNFLELKMKNWKGPLNDDLGLDCFAKLERLELDGCHSLECLIDMTHDKHTPPGSIIPVLHYLRIENATMLKVIFHGEVSSKVCFPALKELEISGCHNLRYLLSPSIVRGLVNLEKLEIGDCGKIEGLVAAVEGEESFECFHNLTSLDVSGCHNLRYLLPPSIVRGLVKLEKLEINDCYKMEGIVAAVEGEESFECFHNLTSLNVTECPNLRYLLPPSIVRGLVKLEKLEINDCNKMDGIVAAVEGEESFECFHNLTSLNVWGCNNLRYLIPPIVRGLVKLEKLKIRWCDKMEGIVEAVEGEESFECFHNLTSVNVADCPNLRYLLPPSIARGLVKLEKLKIRRCGKMEGIVAAVEGEESFECFHNLTSLNVAKCPNLRYLLPPSIVRGLVKLEKLEINDCYKMEGIVAAVEGEESVECFHNLTSLNVTECPNLRYLLPPSIVRGLVKLEKLEINDCYKMEGIVAAVDGEESFECFHNLTSLDVSRCGNLRYLLPPSIARGLVKLEILEISWCDKMEGIVAAVEGEESFECFHNLTSLNVTECPNLRYLLPPSIARGLVKLEKLKIGWCGEMEGIVAAVDGEESFECFQNLTSLDVSRCGNLRYLLPPSIARGLVKLEILEISWCDKMEGIVAAVEGEESFECFHNLTSLNVTECPNLRYLLPPSIARGLVKLEKLKIGWCGEMEGLVAAVEGEESFECFHNLISLNVTECPNLRYLLPPSIARGLVNLEFLGICGCDKIEGIVAAVEGEESFECFHNLTSLYVSRCGNLRYLLPPSIASGLVKLEILEISWCDKMEGIVAAVEGEESFECFHNLTSVNVAECPNLRYLLPPSIARGLVKLEKLQIDFCGKMEGIVAAVEGEESFECFHNLISLNVTECPNLRYLLPPSIARGLVKLEILAIGWCSKMEGIVAAVEEETKEEGMLPRLKYLQLTALPNLRSFKYNFAWPLLKRISCRWCTELNFCPGTLSIPREVEIYVNDCGPDLEQELNNCRKES